MVNLLLSHTFTVSDISMYILESELHSLLYYTDLIFHKENNYISIHKSHIFKSWITLIYDFHTQQPYPLLLKYWYTAKETTLADTNY